jgi:uncharacterized membrane protein (DUF485 family)
VHDRPFVDAALPDGRTGPAARRDTPAAWFRRRRDAPHTRGTATRRHTERRGAVVSATPEETLAQGIEPGPGTVWQRAQRSDDFVQLKRTYRSFAFPLVTAGLAFYFTYVLLTAFARGFVNTRVFDSNITIGFVLGLLQFFGTFLAAWWYSRFANSKLDPVSSVVKAEVEAELDDDYGTTHLGGGLGH